MRALGANTVKCQQSVKCLHPLERTFAVGACYSSPDYRLSEKGASAWLLPERRRPPTQACAGEAASSLRGPCCSVQHPPKPVRRRSGLQLRCTLEVAHAPASVLSLSARRPVRMSAEADALDRAWCSICLCFVCSDFSADADRRRRTGGFTSAGGAVDCRSESTPIAATPAMQTEYRSAAAAVKAALILWPTKLKTTMLGDDYDLKVPLCIASLRLSSGPCTDEDPGAPSASKAHTLMAVTTSINQE